MNECESLVSGCSPNADCTDTDGNYKCSCKLGFVGDGAKCARKYEIIGHVNNFSHNANFHWNFQKYSVNRICAIID